MTHVQAGSVDGGLQVQPAERVAGEHLRQSGRDPVGARAADGQHRAVGVTADRGRHVGGHPGAGRQRVDAAPVQLGLAEAVVQQDAGAGDRRARSVAGGSRCSAGHPVLVDDRDVHGRGRRVRHRVPAVGRPSRAAHGPRRPGPRRCRARRAGGRARPAGWRPAGRRRRPARGVRRARASSVSIAASTGPPMLGGGLVARVQSASSTRTAGRTTARYAARSAAVIRPPRASRSAASAGASAPSYIVRAPSAATISSAAARSGERISSPAWIGAAVRMPQRGSRFGVPAEDDVADQLQIARGGRAQRKALPGHLDGRRHDLGPRRGAVALVGQPQAGQRARVWPPSRGRSTAAAHRRTPSRPRSGPAPKRSAGRPRPGISTLPSTVTGAEPSAGSIGDERPTGQADDARLGHRRDQGGGDRGVDGIAAGGGESQPGVDGEGARGRDRDAGRSSMRCGPDMRGSLPHRGGRSAGGGGRVERGRRRLQRGRPSRAPTCCRPPWCAATGRAGRPAGRAACRGRWGRPSPAVPWHSEDGRAGAVAAAGDVVERAAGARRGG